MKVRLAVAALGLASFAAPALADCGYGETCGSMAPWAGSARDAQMNQAVANTMCANLMRRGIECTSGVGQATLAAVQGRIPSWSASGSVAPFPVVAQGNRTWQQVLRTIGFEIPQPFDLGGFKPGGGDFGGGGAGGSWEYDAGKGNTCEDVDFRLDAQGNLIIPSYALNVGGAIPFGTYFYSQNNSAPGALGQKTIGHTMESRARRVFHLWNMTRYQQDWFGVIGLMDGAIHFATVAYRNNVGQVVGRAASSTSGGVDGPHSNTAAGQQDGHGVAPNTFNHQPCPVVPSNAHFYGYTDWSGPHLHSCVEFIPDQSFGWAGYALNQETTVPYPASGWPNNYPDHIKACPLSPGLLAKLTNEMHKYGATVPGYTGVPHAPVLPGDARPGDARIGDLGDNPELGTTVLPPNQGQSVTPPQPPATSPPVTVDLGPDPRTPAPELGEVPTGIMDPIFDWLPDLPSITFDTNASECPVWALNMTEFGGPEWQWLVDSHCDLLENNRAMIGALMIALFGIGAAVIILRA